MSLGEVMILLAGFWVVVLLVRLIIVRHQQAEARRLVKLHKEKEKIKIAKYERNKIDKEKFLELMRGFGFDNPVQQVVEATKRTQIKWWLIGSHVDTLGERYNFIADLFDGIEVLAGKDQGFYSMTLCYWLIFQDKKMRFNTIEYYSGEPRLEDDLSAEPCLAVKDCLDWLIERFSEEIKEKNKPQ